jgi:uncharacterized membrane protein
MGKGRLEAFSDGVIAIIITIMVLELKVPHGTDFGTLIPVVPLLLSYVLSFIYVGIITCCTSPSASPAARSGRTCICCSGCR